MISSSSSSNALQSSKHLHRPNQCTVSSIVNHCSRWWSCKKFYIWQRVEKVPTVSLAPRRAFVNDDTLDYGVDKEDNDKFILPEAEKEAWPLNCRFKRNSRKDNQGPPFDALIYVRGACQHSQNKETGVLERYFFCLLCCSPFILLDYLFYPQFV